MLNLIVALRAEATPLIKQFNLKQTPTHHYPVFSSEDTTLVISGIGRNAAAAATAWLAATRPATVWLNIGIAGHASRQQGTLLAAHKITEQGTGKSWYPVHIKPAVETENLMTFDSVQHSYISNCLHDMEASGFYESALRFSIAELTHSAKVVTDNVSHSVDNVDKNLAEKLITRNLPQIAEWSSQLRQLAEEIKPAVPVALIRSYEAQWKFTVTQQYQLQRLLQRRQALSPDLEQSIPAELFTMPNSKAALRWLQADTDQMAEFY